MNNTEPLMAFSKEYLKNKDLTEEWKKALDYCLKNKLISQEMFQKTMQAGRDEKIQLMNAALTTYLRHLMNKPTG